MKGKLASLRVDVTQLQSTNLSMLWGKVTLLDAPTSEPPMMPISEPTSPVQPELVARVDDLVDMDAERANDNLAEEANEDDEQRIILTLTGMHEPTRERSLKETSAVGTSEVSSDSTIPSSVVTDIDSPCDTALQPPMILLSSIHTPNDAFLPETSDESAP
uniref:Uncharacterized protein n=1 Tax=Solanum tuberosum TaxID=4113 RepID=M1DUD5_SOLTU